MKSLQLNMIVHNFGRENKQNYFFQPKIKLKKNQDNLLIIILFWAHIQSQAHCGFKSGKEDSFCFLHWEIKLQLKWPIHNLGGYSEQEKSSAKENKNQLSRKKKYAITWNSNGASEGYVGKFLWIKVWLAFQQPKTDK